MKTSEKPQIPADILAKWQRVIDLASAMAQVPAGLIMKTDPPRHSVLIKSTGKENPYRVGQKFELGPELYCQEVIARDDELVVEDANCDPVWQNNEDLEYGMSFYMGYPLRWPDGALLGTLCVLDSSSNERALQCRDLLIEFRSLIEADLSLLTEIARREKAENQLRKLLAGLEQTVDSRTKELKRANTTLQVLVERMASSREEFEADIIRQLEALVKPHMNTLHSKGAVAPEYAVYLELLESSLASITSQFAAANTARFESLTQKETEVAQLILHGKSTKDIARAMFRETSTIDYHRSNIRRKLGLERDISLRSHLMSLQE
ncbi:LuxR C-terminal-related transcriptional regulator [Granulosicoccus sp. 3-233]|uniref:LuxR C-terminal-related transcriptional regulator n=1 Tax=Granulosicoccus sp. 3-233 TaxID=3417969 RepID=UPI003D32FC2D